jgi:hypothetical protein
MTFQYLLIDSGSTQDFPSATTAGKEKERILPQQHETTQEVAVLVQ